MDLVSGGGCLAGGGVELYRYGANSLWCIQSEGMDGAVLMLLVCGCRSDSA